VTFTAFKALRPGDYVRTLMPLAIDIPAQELGLVRRVEHWPKPACVILSFFDPPARECMAFCTEIEPVTRTGGVL
jgi:hypothetical protein